MTNQCAIVDAFYCEEVSGADDLVGDGIYQQLTDNGDGTYETTYTVSIDGTVTLSAFIAKNGGLYAEYFNNAFLDGTPTSTGIDNEIDFDWDTDLVTAEAADFVSARWVGKVRASITEEFTFILHADDGIRLYLQGELVIDRWDECCDDATYTVKLTQDEFYDIRLEWKEQQENAYITLYWSSISTPKEVISPSNLYYVEYITTTPIDVVVTEGPTIAPKSTAVGDGLTTAQVGKLSTIQLTSRDSNGDVLDNDDDNYQITMTGPGTTNTGDMTVTAVYQSAGLYDAQYVPLVSGTFSLSISLLGISIEDSPWTLVITPGEIEPTVSVTDITVASETLEAGMTYFFTVTTKDVYSNLLVEGIEDIDFDIIAEYVSTTYTSPIAIADYSNMAAEFGTDVAGIATDQDDGTYYCQVTIYRAASYNLYVQINNQDVDSSPFSNFFAVEPSDVYAPNCEMQTDPSTLVSGTAYSYNIQGRDFYHNNVVTLASTLSDLTVEIVNKTNGDVIATGSIADHASAGVYTATVTPTTAGEYYLNFKHSGLHFDDSPYAITISAAATTSAIKSNFTGVIDSYQTGDTFKVVISANDLNTNLRTDSNAETFVVTLTEDTSSTVHTLTVTSNLDGTYTGTHLFQNVDTYTLAITFGGTAINGSPQTAISVAHGLV